MDVLDLEVVQPAHVQGLQLPVQLLHLLYPEQDGNLGGTLHLCSMQRMTTHLVSPEQVRVEYGANLKLHKNRDVLIENLGKTLYICI